MKILLLDIETQPMNVQAWGLWDKFIPVDRILTPGYTACFAAKWLGEKEIHFHRVSGAVGSKEFKRSQKAMVKAAYALVNEADAVVHYNGTRFDMPTLNQEFMLQGFGPPAPYANIDLLKTARKQFRLPSNKLNYVAKVLGLGSKTKHKGLEMWNECAAGDEKAWRHMEKYNKQDVKLLEQVYKKLLAWIPNHPNYGIYNNADRPTCNRCGSTHVISRGKARTTTQVYPRFSCAKCGGWLRGKVNETPNRENILVGI